MTNQALTQHINHQKIQCPHCATEVMQYNVYLKTCSVHLYKQSLLKKSRVDQDKTNCVFCAARVARKNLAVHIECCKQGIGREECPSCKRTVILKFTLPSGIHINPLKTSLSTSKRFQAATFC
jgi:hypothetical protein